MVKWHGPIGNRILALVAWMAGAAGCAHVSSPVNSELQSAAAAYAGYFAQIFAEVQKSGARPFPPPETLPEVEKRYNDVVAAADGRADVKQAATLWRDAFGYAMESLQLPKEKRGLPDDMELAKLLGNKQGEITEGRILKCLMIAEVRFVNLFGKSPVTESQVQADPDIDFSAIAN